jgi:hypothetical protein
MSYSLTLQFLIKVYQLPLSSIELKLIGDDIVWYNGVIEPADHNIDYEIVDILMFPIYSDYYSTPVFYLRSNLGSNFFV